MYEHRHGRPHAPPPHRPAHGGGDSVAAPRVGGDSVADLTAADLPPSFDAFGLHPDLLRGVRDMGFLHPTPIQARAIPPILAGRDVIGCAQTGTGKTAAFVLPVVHRFLQTPRRGRIRALVVAPTRELALQTLEHLKALSRHVRISGAAVFGGVSMEPQIQALRRGVDILSATPGRLLDHMSSGRVDFSGLEVLVLDEVDRMLDMGFLPDIRRILRALPLKRQNLVFSATMPPEIDTLVRQILVDPVTVAFARKTTAAVGIRHAVYPVPRHLKTELLVELLRAQGMSSVLVFTRTKRSADKVARVLERHGIRISVIHGDRSQSQRLRALEEFRGGRSRVLVATDIAARGIDVEDISHVVNYAVPATPEDYVHRIGRTARAEATGDAFTLVDPEEESMIREIERTIRQDLPRVTLPQFDYKRPAPVPHGGHGPAHAPSHHGPPRAHGSHGAHGPHRGPRYR
jgi:ATP-dependent RNA helicase RhlE